MIEELLAYVKKTSSSDLHLSAGAVPMVRTDGEMLPIPNAPAFKSAQIREMLKTLMNDFQQSVYQKKLEIDFSVQIGENLRFRVNAFHNLRGAAAVFREVPLHIRTIESLHAPSAMKSLSVCQKGLILVVGPTGSGKSTTLAAMINHINHHENAHIITVEDPIEFVHTNKKSLINQREVGSSTLSFSNALRSALREDPDVILVGEMRDLETIRLALTAAETGHLVFATLHTSSAAQTVNRIIDVFPAEDKPLARSMLSASLKAVISQRLLKKEGGGRCAAFEIMIANASIRNLIREDKIPQIGSIIELGKKEGMCLMKDSVKELLSRGYISQETAAEALLIS